MRPPKSDVAPTAPVLVREEDAALLRDLEARHRAALADLGVADLQAEMIKQRARTACAEAGRRLAAERESLARRYHADERAWRYDAALGQFVKDDRA